MGFRYGEPEGRNGCGWLTCHLPLTNFMTAYNFKRSGLSYVAAGAADGDAEAAGRRTTGGGPNGGGAATAAIAAGAADGDAEAAGRRTTGTIHDFRRNG